MPHLSESHLLRGVAESSLARVKEAGEIVLASKGQRLIEEGAVPQHLLVLVSGRLEVYLPDPVDRARGKRLATLNPGDSCGEYGFVDRRPASATVKAVEDSEVFVVSNYDFDALMRGDPELERIVYRNLLRTLVSRLRASNVVIDLLRSPPE